MHVILLIDQGDRCLPKFGGLGSSIALQNYAARTKNEEEGGKRLSHPLIFFRQISVSSLFREAIFEPHLSGTLVLAGDGKRKTSKNRSGD
jgi:hypothetical protein